MRRAAYFIISVILLSSFVTSNVYSENRMLTIKLDKQIYSAGETMHVTGTVPFVSKDLDISIGIYDSRGSEVMGAGPPPNSDGTYSHDFPLDIAEPDGKYIVKATYSGQTVQAIFDFRFIPASVATNPDFARAHSVKINIDKKEYDIPYNIVNAELMDVKLPKPSLFLIYLASDKTQNGFLKINFPREVLENIISPLCLQHGNIDITIDRTGTVHREIFEGDRITVEFPIPAGARVVEIIGFVILGPGSSGSMVGVPRFLNVQAGQQVTISGIFGHACGRPLGNATISFKTELPSLKSQATRIDSKGRFNITFTVPDDARIGVYETDILASKNMQARPSIWDASTIYLFITRNDTFSVDYGGKTYQVDYQHTGEKVTRAVIEKIENSDINAMVYQEENREKVKNLNLDKIRMITEAGSSQNVAIFSFDIPIELLYSVGNIGSILALADKQEAASWEGPSSCETRTVSVMWRGSPSEIEIVPNVRLALFGQNITETATKTIDGDLYNSVNLRITSADSDVCNASFSPEQKKVTLQIAPKQGINASNRGFMQIEFPTKLLANNFTVTVNGQEPTRLSVGDSRNIEGGVMINVTYPTNTQRIEIMGANAIPEFPVNLMVIAAIALGISVILRVKNSKAFLQKVKDVV